MLIPKRKLKADGARDSIRRWMEVLRQAPLLAPEARIFVDLGGRPSHPFRVEQTMSPAAIGSLVEVFGGGIGLSAKNLGL
jgi:hypothetical protein